MSDEQYHENLSERCPACGRFTSFEENYGYIHNDDPREPLTGIYCGEDCLAKTLLDRDDDLAVVFFGAAK